MKKQVWQNHHLVYASPEHPEQELTVRLTRGHHYVILQLMRCKKDLAGLKRAVKWWLFLHEED